MWIWEGDKRGPKRPKRWFLGGFGGLLGV